MTDIVMPRLTDSMEEGTLIAWLRQDGDEIAVGDELAEIETDKASMTYEADAAGTLRILVEPGTTLPIGTPIATVGEAGDTAAEAPPPAAPPADPTAPAPPTPAAATPRPAPQPPPAGDPEGRLKVSPLARRIAADRGVDLAALHGSGPGGRIIRVDVESAPAGAGTPAAATGPVPGGKGEVETVTLTRTQQLIARRMSESKATIPHFVLRTDVDMRRVVAVREAFKAEAGDLPVPSVNDFVIRATAHALARHPRANAAWRDGTFELYSRVNVGMAVALEDALIVPVITDADHRDLHETAAESRRLAERVRSGEITPPELAGATFTVSNLGMFGVSGFDAVISPGQAGILAVGELAGKPVVEGGELVPGRVMELSLSCDHRILYGADGARFLAAIRAALEEPGLLA